MAKARAVYRRGGAPAKVRPFWGAGDDRAMMKREMNIRDLPKPLQYAAVGVVLDREAVAALATSEKVGDRCLAAGLDKAAAAAEPSGPDGRDLFIYRDRWLQIRDGLAAGCGE